MGKRINKILILVLGFLILATTFAYSALATSMSITSNVIFRVSADIRVTNVSLYNATNATVAYESRYNIDSVTSGFTLPSSNSSITYKVRVENSGDIDETIYNMTLNSENAGLQYSLSGYTLKEVIGYGTVVEFYITYTTTTPSNAQIDVVNKFDYKKVYHIYYDENGGTTVSDQIKYEGVDLVLNKINGNIQTPNKNGYDFAGWSIDGTTKAYDAGDTFTVDNDELPRLTLYALYSLKEYTITYNLNGGTVSTTNPVKYTIETNSFTLNNPSKTGYTFTGWTGSNGNTPNTSVTIEKGSTGNKTYTANYTANELVFNNKTITKDFSTSAQTENNAVDAATNGTGSYSYAITGGNANNYFSLSGRNLTIAANTPANETGYQITITATDNNSNKTKEATYTIKINKLNNTITVTTPQTATSEYSNSATDKNFTAATNAIGSVTYAVNSQKDSNNEAVNYFSIPTNSAATLRIAKETPVGTYTVVVRASAAGNTNYKSGYKDITITVTVTKKTNPITVTTPQEITSGYSESDVNKNFTAATNAAGNVTYAVSSQKNSSNASVNYFSIPTNSAATLKIAKNTPVGTYTVVVRASAAGNANYESGSKDITITVTVTKATDTVTISPKTATYTGNAIAANTATATSGSAITYTYYASEDCSGEALSSAPTNAGKYSVNAVSAGNGNYNSGSKCVKHTIDAKELTITAKAQTVTYGTTITKNVNQVTTEGLITGHTLDSINLAQSTTNVTSNGTITPSAAIIKSGSVDVTSNYDITYETGKLTINAKSLTIPTSPSDKTYTGQSQNSGITCPTGSTASGTQSAIDAGTYTQTCTLSSTTNYKWSDDSTTPKNITWKIEPKELSISWGTLTWDYDGNAHSTTATATTSIDNESITLEISNNSITNKGTKSVTASCKSVTGGQADCDNYTLTNKTKTLTVNAKAITVTAGSSSRAWNNTALTNSTCTSTGLVSGHTVTCTMTSGSTITTAGSVDNVIDEVTIKNGTTDVTDNYTITKAKGTLTVTLATPTLSLTPKTAEYTGNTIAANTVTASPDAGGAKSYTYYSTTDCSGEALTGAPKNVGEYSVKATVAAVANKTNSASICKTHTITAKKGTITLADNSKTLTYKTSGSVTYTYDGDGTVSCLSGNTDYVTCQVDTANHKITVTPVKATTSAVTITVSASAGSNYSAADNKSFTVTVNKKALTITAKEQTVAYGTEITKNTSQVTVSGLESGDTLDSITLAQSKTAVSTDGKITPSAAVIKNGSTNVTANYNITYATGDLTITKKNITASISSCSNKTYNGNTNASCQFTPSGVVGSETVTISGTCTFNNKNVGTDKAVTCTSLTLGGTNAGNYNLTTSSLSGTADITAKTLTASVTAEDKTYDGTLTATCSNSATLTGIVSGDTVTASVNTTGTFADKNAGTNKTVTCSGITLAGADKSNYSISSTANTTADINKKQVTVKADDKPRNYGSSAAQTYSYTVTGAVSGETAVSGTASYKVTNSNDTEVTVNASLAAGEYTITPSSLTAGSNYTIKYSTGILTVEKIDAVCPSITAYSGTYDGDNHTITTGTPTGGTLEYRTATSGDGSTWTTTKPTRKNQGTTTVYVRVNGDSNHNTKTCSNSSITISKREVTVKADNKSRNYGSSTAQTYSYTVTGAVSGEEAVSGTASYKVTNSNDTEVTVNSSLAAGTYTITPSGLTAGSNYTIKYSTGTLTVNKVAATLNCSNKTYNGEEQTACTCTGGTVGGEYKATNYRATAYEASCTPDTNHTAPSNKTWTMAKKTLDISAYSVAWVSGTTYTRSNYDTNTNNEKITLVYTPNSNTVGEYTYATTTGANKYLLAINPANNNYSINSAGKLTITGSSIQATTTVTGTNTWGQTLTANPSCTVPSSGCSFTYQWYETTTDNATSGGTAISGATSKTYSIPKEKVGKNLYVVVTVSATNYTTTTVSAATTAATNTTAKVAKQNLSATATAYSGTYDGSSHGATIKVNSSAWDGKTIVSGTSASYGNTVTSNGEYNTNYTLEPKYTNVVTNASIYYKVTGGTYYNDLTGSTTVTISKKKPTITSASDTKALTYPTAGSVTYTYDGDGTVTCESADETYVTCQVNTTNKTVTLTPVKVTSSAVNVTLKASAGSNYSAADNKVIAVTVGNGTLTSGSVVISGTNTWGQTLTATITNTTPTATYTCTWYKNSISSANSLGTATVSNNSCTYTIPKEQVGNTIYVRVVASKANYSSKNLDDATDATNNTTAAVAKQNLSVTANAYSGVYDGSSHGATLTVNSPSWNGTVVSGTSTSYGNTVTATDGVYTLLPKYTNVTNTTNIYYKVNGGTYYNDRTGSTTVTITSKPVSKVTNLAVSTGGYVTWTNAANATEYLISIDKTNWTPTTGSGYDYLSTIIASTGSRKVYVKAINSDGTNYTSDDGSVAEVTVNVVTLSASSNNTNYGTVSGSPLNVISGAKYTTSGGTLTVNGITTGTSTRNYPNTITASAKSADGYTTVLSNWSPASSNGVTSNTSVTANFTRTANIYHITLNNQSATSTGTAGVYYQYKTTKEVDGVTCYYYTDAALTTCLTSGYYITKPTKTGYTFGGYYTSTGGSGTQYVNDGGSFVNNIYQKYPAQINSSYTNDITLYAKWTANIYTIGYTMNGGNNPSIKPIIGTYDENVQISNPTKTFTVNIDANDQGASIKNASGTEVTSASSAQTFAGWSSSSISSTAMSGSTTSNYASWNGTTKIKNTYFKNLRSDTGTVNMVANWSTANVTLPNITKTGYTCGYATSSSGAIAYNSGASYPASATAANVTLYAKCNINQYTLTINPNGGSFNETTSNTTVTQNYGTTYSVSNNPTRTGYVFTGWTKSGTGTYNYYDNSVTPTSTTTLNYDSASSTLPNVYNNKGNGTVTREMVADSTAIGGYSLKITTNGEAVPNAGGIVPSLHPTTPSRVVVIEVKAKIPSGYNLNAVTGNLYQGTGSIYQSDDRTGNGNWKTYYLVYYYGDTGGFSSATYLFLSGTDNTSVTWYVDYIKMLNFSRENFKSKFTFGAGNGTLTANWATSGSKVSFKPNGGTFNTTYVKSWTNNYFSVNATNADRFYRYDTAYGTHPGETVYDWTPDTRVISRTGYTFDGWYTAETGGTQVFNSKGELNASVSGYSDANKKWLKYDANVTLYARWIPITYALTANANGGSIASTTGWTGTGNTSTKSITYDAAYGTLPSVSKTGYTLSKWNTSSDGTGTDVTASTKLTTTADQNIYAIWSINNPATPTISGGTTKVYGTSATTLTCSTTTSYSGATKYYSFGYSTTDGGTPGNWTTATTTNTLSIAADAYRGSRYYSCRVYATDGTNTSSTVASATTADTEMSLINARIDFNGNNGTVGTGTNPMYVSKGYSNIYTTRTGSTAASIPTATKEGYTFNGWYTASTGGSQVINSSGVVQASVSGWTDKDKKWLLTLTTNTANTYPLYAHYTANDLVFENQTVTSTFNASTAQTITNGITEATNGTGTYTYEITGGNTNNYFSLNGRNIIVAKNTPANTTGYSVTITATDSNSGVTKNATYTIKVNKAANPISVTATQSGSVTYSTSAQTKAFTAATNGQGTVTYSITSQKSGTTDVTYFSIPTNTTASISVAKETPAGTYTIVVRASAAGNANYNSGSKTITYTLTVNKANCLMTVSNASMTTGGTLDLTTKTANAVGTVSYTIKTNGTTTASSLSGTNNKTLTAGAMSSENDTAQSVVVTATEAASKNYNTCSKDITVTVNKKANTLAANNQTVYVNSQTAYTSLIKTNNGGALSATIGTDNTAGSTADNTNKKFIAGVLAATDDANKTVSLTMTSARTTTVAEGSANVTVTVQKYTNALSWTTSNPATPAANATLTYGNSYTVKATAASNGGTNGAITYSSNNTAGATVNNTSGVITVVNGNAKAVTITASMVGTTTVKAATTTRAYKTGKATGYVTLDADKSIAYGTASTTFSVKTNHGGSLSVSDDNTSATCSINNTTVTCTGLGSINAGTTVKVTVTSAATDNYTAASKVFNLTFTKVNPTLTLSATTGTIKKSASTTFTEKANVAGNFGNVSGTKTVATVSPDSYSSVNANTAKTVTVTGAGKAGNSTVTVTFTPTDTTNYNTVTATYTVTTEEYTSTITFNPNTASGATSANTLTTPTGCSKNSTTGIVTCSCKTSGTSSTCSITSPTISNEATSTVIGFSTLSTAGATTNKWTHNTSKDFTNGNGGTYYAQTTKAAVDGKVTFNPNGNTKFTYSSTDYTSTTAIKVCTIDAVYNGTAQATSCSASITMPSITAPTGFTVKGWTTAAGTHSGYKTGTQTVTSGQTYYAQSEKAALTFTAKWNANNATLSSTTDSSCTIDAVYNGATQGTSCTVDAPTITAPTNTPTVVGFNTTANSTANNSSYNVSTGKLTLTSSNSGNTWYAITSKAKVTLTATTQKNVTSATGTGTSATCDLAATYNGTAQATSCEVTLPANPYTLTNWTFNGWVNAGASTTTTTTSGEAANASMSISSNVNIVATWKKTVAVSLTFDKNGGSENKTSGSVNTTLYNGATSIPTGTSLTFTAPSCTTYTSWTCLGYNTSATDTTSAWNVGATKSISVAGLSVGISETSASKASGYYHIWRNSNYNTSYKATTQKNLTMAGGTGTNVSCTIGAVYNGDDIPTSCEVTLPANPYTLTNWTFNGWVNAGTSTTTTTTSGQAASSKMSISSNVNIVATWKKTVAVFLTFDKNGGSAHTISASVNTTLYNGATSIPTGTHLTFRAPACTTKSGYTCLGYNTSASATTSSLEVGATKSFSVAGLSVGILETSAIKASGYYHVWSIDDPEAPTITGGAQKVYNYEDTTLTCSTSTTYASGTDIYYSFGYSTSSTGTLGNWTTASTTNTLSINKDEFRAYRYYACRVYASDGTVTSSTVTSTSRSIMELVNARIYFSRNGGTSGGNVSRYVEYDSSNIYSGRTNTKLTKLPSAAVKTGQVFTGWYTSSSGGTQVITADGTVNSGVSGWTDSSGKWILTSTTLHRLYAQFRDPIITYDNMGGIAYTGDVDLFKIDGRYINSSAFNSSNIVTGFDTVGTNTAFGVATRSGATLGSDYISFDGTNDYVELTKYYSPTYITMGITFEVSSLDAGVKYLIGNHNGTNGGIEIYLNNNNQIKATASFMSSTGTAGPTVLIGSTETIEIGKKYNVVTTYDGTTFKIFINGELVNSSSYSGVIASPVSTKFTIGKNAISSSYYFKGKVYDAYFYGSAMDDSYIVGNSSIANVYSKTVTYNTAYGVLPIPERTGYTFTGWNTEEDGTGTDVCTSVSTCSNSTVIVSASTDHTLYAQWSANNGNYLVSSNTSRYYSTLSEAISAATSGATITLQKNTKDSSGIGPGSKTIILNLNGYSLDRVGGNVSGLRTIELDNGKLYLSGGKISTTSSIPTLTISGYSSDSSKTNGEIIAMSSDGAAVAASELEGTTIISNAYGNLSVNNGARIKDSNTLSGILIGTVKGSLNIVGSTITSYNTNNGRGIYPTSASGAFSISNSRIEAYSVAIYRSSEDTASTSTSISNSTIIGNTSDAPLFISAGTLTLSNTNIKNNSSASDSYGLIFGSSSKNCTINSGTDIEGYRGVLIEQYAGTMTISNGLSNIIGRSSYGIYINASGVHLNIGTNGTYEYDQPIIQSTNGQYAVSGISSSRFNYFQGQLRCNNSTKCYSGPTINAYNSSAPHLSHQATSSGKPSYYTILSANSTNSSNSTSSLQSSSKGSLLNKSITSIKPDEELEENTNENEIDGVKEEEESLEEETKTNENESSETSENEEISVITDESSSIAKFLNIVKNDNTGIISIEIIVIFALVSFVIIKRYNYKIIKKEKNKDKKSIITRIINKFKNRHKKKKRNKKKV